ncbi:MAG: tetratricopeptide repeat protein [Hyphomicrobiaceae bacterium]|nr:tetratricopeptide repeat protein [Hyphomicrobiaceae bacterium]
MPETDRYGLALSTDNAAAADAYRRGHDLMLAAWPGADAAFDEAVALDPAFALAHVARARLHLAYAEVPAARQKAQRARELGAQNATERERSHVDAIARGVEGDPAGSLAASLAHLERWPRDALVLSLPLGAFGLYAFSGIANHDQARVDLCERHARHYGPDWWFLTYLGWSHTENGSAGAGRLLTERALELRRENANAAHALAHALYEDGSVAAADRFIDDWLPGYDPRAILHGHIAWHQALLALEQADAPRALAIYRRAIARGASHAAPLNAVTDRASLLWRAGVCGADIAPALWEEAAEDALGLFPQAGVHFADVHVALAAAAAGRREALEARVAGLEARLAEGRLAPGPVLLAICRGVRAFSDGDYRACAQLLEPAAADVVRIGGSHAQRDLVEDTLIVALIKAGETERARKLLDTRLHRRPSLRDARWRAGLETAPDAAAG